IAGRRADRERVGERDLARLFDEQVVERLVHVVLGEEPGGAGDELDFGRRWEVVVVGGAFDELAIEFRLLVSLTRFLQPAELEALRARDLLDLLEQVVDRLVAVRGDADPLARSHQVDEQARSGPGLAGAGRPLDEEIALVEAEGDRLRVFELDRFALKGRSRFESVDTRQSTLDHVPQGTVWA